MAIGYTDPSGLGVSTHVSGTGSVNVDPNLGGASASPGASGPGGNMSVAHSALVIIGASAAGLVALAIVFRRPVGK